MKKILYYIFIFLLLFIAIPQVFASDMVDLNKVGSISLTLKDNDNYFSDIDIKVYHIADLELDNHYINYVYTSSFKDYSNTFESDIDSNDLLEYINNHNIEGITITTNDVGYASVNSLSLGVYLVVQESSISNYTDFTPTIVYLPSLIDDDYNYTVDITPKINIDYLNTLTIKKVWNDNITNHEEIKVKVSNDKESFEIVLNEGNNWTYSWQTTSSLENYKIVELDIPSSYTATYDSNGNTLTITNSQNLIQTGLEIIPIIIMSMLGIGFILVGLNLRYEKKVK